MCVLLAVAGCKQNAQPERNRDNPEVTLAPAGDILLDRGVAKQIARQGEDYPLALVRDDLGDEVALEGPFGIDRLGREQHLERDPGAAARSELRRHERKRRIRAYRRPPPWAALIDCAAMRSATFADSAG